MCANLRTVAASNSRIHPTRSTLLLLARATYIKLFFAHIPFVVNRAFSATPAERFQQFQMGVVSNENVSCECGLKLTGLECRGLKWIGLNFVHTVLFTIAVFYAQL